MPGIASAATAIVIAHVAQGTTTIRVGAGGIMLPEPRAADRRRTVRHAGVAVSRPDRSRPRPRARDRSDHGASRCGARSPAIRISFPQDVLELMAYFQPEEGQRVRAVPGAGLSVPIYILGSSLFGAQVAAAFGLPFAFASHFAAQQMMPAVQIYRERLQAVRPARTPVRDARGEHHRGGHRCRGAAARDIRTAVLREPARRHPDRAAATRPGVGEGRRALRRDPARNDASRSRSSARWRP